MAEVARQRGQAMVVSNDNLFQVNRAALTRAALKYVLPTMVANREYLEAGGLVSCGHSDAELNRRYAAFVDRFRAARSLLIFRSSNPRSSS